MGFLSILPESFSIVEAWVTRLFLILACITIGPWAILLLYDLFLYIFRSISYEVPYIGGRARGKARPRAPSLTERPSGHRRNFSLGRRPQSPTQTTAGFKPESPDARLRRIREDKYEDSPFT